MIVRVGTNYASRSNTADDVADSMGDVKAQAKKKFPKARVTVRGIIHRRDTGFRYNTAINDSLRKLS